MYVNVAELERRVFETGAFQKCLFCFARLGSSVWLVTLFQINAFLFVQVCVAEL